MLGRFSSPESRRFMPTLPIAFPSKGLSDPRDTSRACYTKHYCLGYGLP